MKNNISTLKNPNYLDTTQIDLSLLPEDSEFVEIPFLKQGYFINQYGDLINKRKRLLKPQMYGTPGDKRPSYRLPLKSGEYKNFFSHQLVAYCFVKDKSIDDEMLKSLEIHHINGNSQEAYFKNLMYLNKDEHRAINFRLFLYDFETGKFKRFSTIQKLCNFTHVDLKCIYKDVYYRYPDFTFYNGLNGYIIDGVYYKDLPMLLGIERLKGDDSYKTLKMGYKQGKLLELLEAI